MTRRQLAGSVAVVSSLFIFGAVLSPWTKPAGAAICDDCRADNFANYQQCARDCCPPACCSTNNDRCCCLHADVCECKDPTTTGGAL